MKKNMGTTDRTIRMILGVLVGAAGIYFNSWWGLIGLIPLLTAFIGWCPAYVPFGLSSCKKRESQ